MKAWRKTGRARASSTTVASLLLLLILLPAAAAGSDAETVVSLEPHASFRQVGETLTLQVRLVNVESLYGVEVTVYWNASLLNMTDVDVRLGESDGVLYEPIFSPITDRVSIEKNRCTILGTSQPPAASFNGSGTIAILTFNVTAIGQCELSLESKLASNIMTSTGVEPITHTKVSGFFGPIQISVSPGRVALGEKVNVTGFVVVSQTNVEVAVEHRLKDGNWQAESVTTDESGNFHHWWEPQESGTYEVRVAVLIGDIEATSPLMAVTVEQPEASLLPFAVAAIIICSGIIAAASGIKMKTKTPKKEDFVAPTFNQT